MKSSLDLSGAAPFVPKNPTLPKLRSAVRLCQGCDLCLNGTRAIFGDGPANASLLLIGEQPGDEEEIKGQPFVGPAGKLLDRALQEASIDRAHAYVTNAVKHFKFEERGKRRLHKKPSLGEISACRPWLEAEVAVIQPKVIVCLGATAAQTVFGNKFLVTKERGVPHRHPWATYVIATIHPAAILRAPDVTRRKVEYEAFIADLKTARKLL